MNFDSAAFKYNRKDYNWLKFQGCFSMWLKIFNQNSTSVPWDILPEGKHETFMHLQKPYPWSSLFGYLYISTFWYLLYLNFCSSTMQRGPCQEDADCCCSGWRRIWHEECFEHDDEEILLKFFIDNVKMLETVRVLTQKSSEWFMASVWSKLNDCRKHRTYCPNDTSFAVCIPTVKVLSSFWIELLNWSCIHLA